MPERSADFELLLRALQSREVEFLVVGGASAVLQGAPILTLDLDIVQERSSANAARLLAALKDLDACYREHLPNKILRPRERDLAGPGHHLLMTRAGPLDVLGAIGAGRDYAYLLPRSEAVTVAGSLTVRVLDLPTLIQVKEEAGRDKDAQGLVVLRHLLEERSRRDP